MNYERYCTSSPWCDEDSCRCEAYAEEETIKQADPRYREPVVIGIDYGLLDTADEDLHF